MGDDLYDPNTGGQDVYGYYGSVDSGGITVPTDNPGLSQSGNLPVTTINVPNNSSAPAPNTGSPSFNLGTIAQGINAIPGLIQGTVNAVRSAQTAVTALNTPTPTSQWLAMPLQSQIIIGLVVFAVLYTVLHGK
jgi:hypothetical protein